MSVAMISGNNSIDFGLRLMMSKTQNLIVHVLIRMMKNGPTKPYDIRIARWNGFNLHIETFILYSTYWGRGKIADILQTTYPNAF